MNENGLVPSRLVFGVLHRHPIQDTNQTEQKEQLAEIKAAQAEGNSVVSERRILEALNRTVTFVPDRFYKMNKDVLFYCKNKNEMVRPLILARIDAGMKTL